MRRVFSIVLCCLFAVQASTLYPPVVAAGAAENSSARTEGFGLVDAVRRTLARNPDILLQAREVEVRRGELEIAGGPFDPTFKGSLSRSDEYTPFTSHQRSSFPNLSDVYERGSSYRLSLDKQFQTGTIISPGIAFDRNYQNTLGYDAESRASVNFSIYQPLLRGVGASGRYVTGEKAAGYEYEAARSDLHHTVSSSVQDVVGAYWDYYAACRNLEILKESEESAARLVELIESLIEADERPRSDIGQVEANLADKAAARIDAEQSLLSAQQALGGKMGVTSREIAELGPPVTPFPHAGSAAGVEDGEPGGGKWIDYALAHRSDFKASKLREDSASQLLLGAENNMLPQVDVQLDVGYSGLDEGNSYDRYFTPLGSNLAGVNVGVKVIAGLPLTNVEAKGGYRRRKALLDQQKIHTGKLERLIGANVTVALSALGTSAEGLRKSQRAVRFYQEAIENERTKLLLGMATIIDLISLEDRLTKALQNNISYHVRHARAVASLRFETGTLVERSESGRYRITMEHLTRAPDIGREGGVSQPGGK